MDGGRLQKAAPEASLAREKDLLAILTAVKLEEVYPGLRALHMDGYVFRSPPPACQYTGRVPPLARSRGEVRPPETAAGPVLDEDQI